MEWDSGDNINPSHSFEDNLVFTASSLRQDLRVSAKLMLSPCSVVFRPQGSRDQRAAEWKNVMSI